MANVKSAPFVTGVLLGVIVALLAVLALRDGTQPAYAQGAASGPATVGNMTIVTGMSQQNLTDLMYVLSIAPNGTNKHLAVYQCVNGRTLKLVATRDITWDLQVPMMKNDPPSPATIKVEVEKALKKQEEELKRKLQGKR
jgi:hypothetical protein